MRKLIERINQWDSHDWREIVQDFVFYGLILIVFLTIIKKMVSP